MPRSGIYPWLRKERVAPRMGRYKHSRSNTRFVNIDRRLCKLILAGLKLCGAPSGAQLFLCTTRGRCHSAAPTPGYLRDTATAVRNWIVAHEENILAC